ncbi:protein of unknown function [Cupriavidus neocaledonicus]|uniref:Uncharacterized protein n=1 Tax=Cupriavidus neocaledonicus TaxID=1040979 RepID=A0A375H629_9BURK|nr:hypothetical protein CBM2605_A210042 [Cupriavidus neocaledonicus]SPD47664.1 protein of unknown function [Cupriavidus neocaledonicus]
MARRGRGSRRRPADRSAAQPQVSAANPARHARPRHRGNPPGGLPMAGAPGVSVTLSRLTSHGRPFVADTTPHPAPQVG